MSCNSSGTILDTSPLDRKTVFQRSGKRAALVILPLTVFILGGFILPGCIPSKQPTHKETRFRLPREAIVLHTVSHPGESISMIAAWYTGNENNWQPILDLNGNLKEGTLYPGYTVRIPAHLVVNEAPLEKSFAENFLAVAKQRKADESARTDQPETKVTPKISSTVDNAITDEFLEKAIDVPSPKRGKSPPTQP
ncbi:MAG: hypothetical protein KDD70_13135 [Bdellovibrionales bacterium]|nr:hypothetical protein [Bdellovibrionales bacterium]